MVRPESSDPQQELVFRDEGCWRSNVIVWRDWRTIRADTEAEDLLRALRLPRSLDEIVVKVCCPCVGEILAEYPRIGYVVLHVAVGAGTYAAARCASFAATSAAAVSEESSSVASVCVL